MTDLDGGDEPNVEDEEEYTSLAMFEGDTSTLFPDQRRCLNALLKNRYLSADRNPEQWAVLMANTDLIRSRLNDLFLDLRVDRVRQIAFKRQAANGDEPLPSLLRASSHTKEETIVMVYLRRRFLTQRREGDDVVFVDRQALLDEVADMRPVDATNLAMDRKRADKAIESLASAGVLLRTGDPDRFQISPIVEVLMPVEKLRALWTWLIETNQGGTDPDEDLPADETLDDLLVDADEEES